MLPPLPKTITIKSMKNPKAVFKPLTHREKLKIRHQKKFSLDFKFSKITRTKNVLKTSPK